MDSISSLPGDSFIWYEYLFKEQKDTIVIASSDLFKRRGEMVNHRATDFESFYMYLSAKHLVPSNQKINLNINFYYKPFISDLKGVFYPNSANGGVDSTILFQKSIIRRIEKQRWPLADRYYSDFIELDLDATMSTVHISYNIPRNMTFYKYYATYEDNKSDSILLKGLENKEVNKTLKKGDFNSKKRQYDSVHIIILSFASVTLFAIFLIELFKFWKRGYRKKNFSISGIDNSSKKNNKIKTQDFKDTEFKDIK